MKPLTREERKSIFKNEILLLKDGNYISSRMYDEVINAHQNFYTDLEARERSLVLEADVAVPTQTDPILKPNSITSKKLKPHPPKVKRKLSVEEMRERNITWLLNLGVILLLIGGLYVATSNWEMMSNITKAGSIGLISILFYGISFVAQRILRITKTAFSFIVLGSLFLPIFLLSIGWFQLIGTYLSIFGEGRYLFGLLSSLLILPVYVLHARRLSSRLFVWFSYLTVTVGTGFLIAFFRLEEDGFFLGMMLFQAVFIFLYHRAKSIEKFKLFTKEFLYFAQLNLILTTMLMLVFYHSHVYFGFNLVLTAIVYLSMVYVTGRKEFHFVFSGMLVYGVYQLVEFSILDELSPLMFALVGFVFLLVPRVLDDQFPWKKIFTLTSGVISGLAFLYISFEAILIKWGEPSFVLLLGYITIAGNFLFLSHTTKKLLFRYMTAVFISVSLFEGILLVDELMDLKPFVLFVFLIGLAMFAFFGVFIRVPIFKTIMQPARDVGWVYMGLASYAAIAMYAWWEVGVMLLLISLCAYLSLTKETRGVFKPFGEWMVPIALSLSITAFSEELRLASTLYESELGVTMHFLLAGLVLLGIHYILKNEALKRNHFYVAQTFYTIGLICAIFFPMNEWVRPVVFIGGVAIYAKLYAFTKVRHFTYLVSVITLLSYFMVLHSVGELGNIQYIAGAVLLYAVSLVLKNKDSHLFKAFVVVAHLYMPFAFLLTLFLYGKESLWSFVIGLVIYGLSTRFVNKEWQKKLFLYSSFIMVFAVFSTGIAHFENIRGEFAFLLTSIVLTGFWSIADPLYKKRTVFYLVPFSFLGVFAFLTMYPFEALAFIVTLLYSIGILVILHLCKWEILSVIPTLLIYVGTLQYLSYHTFAPVNELLTLAVFGVLFLLAGRWFYYSLFEKHSGKYTFSIDVYSLAGILFFVTMYLIEGQFLWTKLLPGLLISSAIWLQRNRIPVELKWVPTFIAGAYLLQPYYTLIEEFNVHYLVLREALVLPLIALGIYLRLCLKGKHEKFTSNLQWGILFSVALVLVVDGLQTSTIYDALILGTLSLISILTGVFLRIKSYFFVGSGVLLLNVFMQTRPFWGNLPWWAYLLIAGSVLIGVASSNEWSKQKTARGETTLVSALKNKAIAMWKQWK